LRFGNAGQGFLAVRGFFHSEALFFQVIAQHGREGCLIFHDEYGGAGQNRNPIDNVAIGHVVYSRCRTTA